MTEIQSLGRYANNNLWIKRDDLLPFSFGGNKARKARLFFDTIDRGNYDCVITYGSSSSNHCRIIANECCRRGLECYIISPIDDSKNTFNSQMMSLFNAEFTKVPVNEVHDTIVKMEEELIGKGRKPFFIEGGGHGNIGTEAYVRCYNEINEQEKEIGIQFDYIFFACGTGTTQAGLICGKLLNADKKTIVGISIARKNPRCRNIVLESVKAYLGNKVSDELVDKVTICIDEYTEGYGKEDRRVIETIKYVLRNYGIPLDTTYTGKAFLGMTEYMKNISNKNCLFIHTGGTPIFFDDLRCRI